MKPRQKNMTEFDYEKSIWGAREATLKWTDPARIRLKEILSTANRIQSGGRVLEIGCGAGQFIRAVGRGRPDLVCAGCDISRTALNRANELGGAVFTLSQNNCLPYVDGEFDMVIVADVLEHVKNPQQFLVEAHRVLKTGGILYLFAPCEGDWLSLWNWINLFKQENLTKKFAGHVQKFNRADLRILLKEASFEIERTRYSEHILGQLAGVYAFFAMSRSSKLSGGAQINNEQYFSGNKQSGILSKLLKFANILISLETQLFSFLPSPNPHFTAKKL